MLTEGREERRKSVAAAVILFAIVAVVMASMAFDGDVRKNLLDRTDAEKVFRNGIESGESAWRALRRK